MLGALELSFWLASLTLGPAGAERWRPPELRVADRPPARFEELKRTALAYLGRPYVSGGVGSPGFDCSGFTGRVFAECGYGLPRVSRDQAEAGRPVSLAELEPGDLLFFVTDPGQTRITHVGLYLGANEMVHAASGQGRVMVSSIATDWWRGRLVSARRIIGATAGSPEVRTSSTSSRAIALLAPTRELIEHEEALPWTLRLPDRLPQVALGPELMGFDASAIALRSALVTERGVLGLVVSPELTLRLESLALSLLLAVPVRFRLSGSPTVGPIDRVADVLRFLRSASLGLTGAALELRLSRLDDLSLFTRSVVDRFAPGGRSSGVPGLSLERSALSFFGGVRTDSVRLEALIDDVVDPSVLGVGAAFPLPELPLELSGVLATDQRADRDPDPAIEARRALWAGEAALTWSVDRGRRGAIDLSGKVAAERGAGTSGLGLAADLSGELRLDRSGGSALSGRIEAGLLGSGFLIGLFGPTYAGQSSAHLVALEQSGQRFGAYGELWLRLDRLVLGAGYGDGFGDGRSFLDRRVIGLVELRGLRLGGTRLLDLRAAFSARGALGARGPADPPAPAPIGTAAFHGGARLRLNSWAFLELYLDQGQNLEGGGGLTIGWLP